MKYIKKLKEYLTGVVSELQKVSFPNKNQVIVRSSVVLVVIVVSTLIIGAIDFGASEGLKLIIIN